MAGLGSLAGGFAQGFGQGASIKGAKQERERKAEQWDYEKQKLERQKRIDDTTDYIQKTMGDVLAAGGNAEPQGGVQGLSSQAELEQLRAEQKAKADAIVAANPAAAGAGPTQGLTIGIDKGQTPSKTPPELRAFDMQQEVMKRFAADKRPDAAAMFLMSGSGEKLNALAYQERRRRASPLVERWMNGDDTSALVDLYNGLVPDGQQWKSAALGKGGTVVVTTEDGKTQSFPKAQLNIRLLAAMGGPDKYAETMLGIYKGQEEARIKGEEEAVKSNRILDRGVQLSDYRQGLKDAEKNSPEASRRTREKAMNDQVRGGLITPEKARQNVWQTNPPTQQEMQRWTEQLAASATQQDAERFVASMRAEGIPEESINAVIDYAEQASKAGR